MKDKEELIKFLDDYEGDIFVPENWGKGNYAIISIDVYNYNKTEKISELISQALFEWRDSQKKDNCAHKDVLEFKAKVYQCIDCGKLLGEVQQLFRMGGNFYA